MKRTNLFFVSAAAIIIGTFAVVSLVSAATTISTNIQTDGTLSVTGTMTGTNANFSGSVGIGTTTPSSALTLDGNLDANATLEIHNAYAVGEDIYVHNDAQFRAPYINFWKSRGTEGAPTAVQYTGYEANSIGGINFGGYDGSAYNVGAAFYTNTDENWTPTNHGAHVSAYFTPVGHTTQNQIFQFGGVDANGYYGYDNISYAALNFGGNSSGLTQINGQVIGYPDVLRINRGDGSTGATLSVDNITVGPVLS